MLEEHPERLTQIKGITRKRALAMGEHFRQQMGMRRLLEFLGEHEVPLQLAMPLYRKYGDRALEIIRGNPYLLVDRELGVDFSNADALALSMGMEGDDPQRLEAGLLFELTHNLDNGHTFLPRRKLLPATAQLIGVGEEALEEALEALLERGEVVEEPVAGEQAVYLHDLCEAEQYVAFRLWELAAGEIVAPHGLEELIDRIQAEQGITYAPQQRQAVELAATSQVMLLTGGPGTGKTTSLRGVLALFDALGLETALAAPTGRAAKRLGELCGAEGTTIHRLLETQYDPHSGRLVFAHDESDPLKADTVIVDETSMVDITLMHGLLSALRPECRLILVGDPDQLPSVGPGNLLGEIIRSGLVPTVCLNEIFRQAAQSLIVENAHHIISGEPLKKGDKLVQANLAKSLEMIAENGPDEFYKGTIAEQIAQEMQKNGGLITKEDLAAYKAVERTPISGDYRGYQVYSMPPPSSGGIHIVQILNILENFDMKKYGFGSADAMQIMAEAEKYAYADRSEYLGDPDFVKVPWQALTNKAYAKSIADQIDINKAKPSSEIRPGKLAPYESNQTTHYSVVDKDGNAVAVTYTLNTTFGTGIVAGESGILLNNQMDDFSAKPGVPNVYGLVGGDANAVGPNKRPLSSMSPTIVVKDGKTWLVTGSPGGSRIITTVLQMVVNSIDYGMNVAEATNAPRFHHQWLPDELRVEKGFSPDTLKLLEAKGQKVALKEAMGSTQSIMVGPDGELYGASDPRSVDDLTAGY